MKCDETLCINVITLIPVELIYSIVLFVQIIVFIVTNRG